MIVEVLVIQTQGRTPQGVDTHFQHVVNTDEVERLKIIKQTGQKPIFQEKINQATKHGSAQKTTEIPKLQCIDEAIDDTVVQVPRVQVVVKNRWDPTQTQTIQSTRTSKSLGGAPVRQKGEAEAVKVDMVKPGDPDAKIKFLEKEVPHGVGLSPTRTETVLPMNWEDGSARRERCGRTTFHPVPLWTTPSLMTSLGSASTTLDVESESSSSLVQYLPKIRRRPSRRCRIRVKPISRLL